MRPLEVAFLLANLPLLAGCVLGRALPAWGRWAIALPVALLAAHMVFEGPRWHMGPGYLVTAGLAVACAIPGTHGPGRWTALAGVVLLIGAAALGTVLPVFTLPKPTGPHPVGTVTLHLTDAAREETQGASPGGRRELMVQVWYPAEHSGPGRPYRMGAEVSFPKDHLALVRTNAAEGVPIAGALPRYPVVLFSPSWIGRRSQNTVQAEELASHGFVVVGIDHPYGTDLTVFSDGRQARTTLGEFLDNSTEERFAAGVRTAEAQLQVRVADVRFVLDELERLNRAEPTGLFTDRLDTARVGIFGHSFGGAVAAEVCRTDPRVKAGVNMDGYIFGAAAATGFGKPFLVLSDVNPLPTRAEVAASQGAQRREWSFMVDNVESIRRGLAEQEGCWVGIHGTSHMNFCDSPLYTPLKRFSRAGPIEDGRAMEIINAYLLAFFRMHLNGTGDPVLNNLHARFPEVEVERIPKRGAEVTG